MIQRPLSLLLPLLNCCLGACVLDRSEPSTLCEAEGFFEEGLILVSFIENVDTDRARRVIEDEGYEVAYFIRMQPALAQVMVPVGTECAVMFELGEHPLIEFTALVITATTYALDPRSIRSLPSGYGQQWPEFRPPFALHKSPAVAQAPSKATTAG